MVVRLWISFGTFAKCLVSSVCSAAGSSCSCLGLGEPEHTPCFGVGCVWQSRDLRGFLQVGKHLHVLQNLLRPVISLAKLCGCQRMFLIFPQEFHVVPLHRKKIFVSISSERRHLPLCSGRCQWSHPVCLELAEGEETGWGQGTLTLDLTYTV